MSNIYFYAFFILLGSITNALSETYPAIVDENSQEMKPVPESKLPKSLPQKTIGQNPKKAAPNIKTLALDNKTQKKRQPTADKCENELKVTPSENISKKSKFDFHEIPVTHVDSFSERLQIVHDILVFYGLAYDYKALTLSELKRIKSDLDKSEM